MKLQVPLMGASASAPTSPEYERALRLFNAEQLQEMEAAFSRVSGSKRAYHATVTPKLFQELVQLPPELRGLVGEELFLSTAAASPSPGSVSLRDMVVMKGLLERGSDAELRNVCWKLLDPASAGTVPVERIRRLTAALAAACDALPAAAGGAAAPSQQHPMLSALTAGLRTLGGASAPGVRGGAAEKQLCRKEAVQEWLKQTPAVTNAARGLLSAFPPPAGPAKAACFALPNAAGPQLNYPPSTRQRRTLQGQAACAARRSARRTAKAAESSAWLRAAAACPKPEERPLVRGARREVCSMDAAWAWLLSALLPPSQREGWDLLYHSDIHGKSFNTFMEQAGGQGPCIVFVKDKSGQVFGGYASDSWVKKGSFYGTFSCIVFSLLPSFLVHVASGANDNFQWCGHNFREIPNGIGWGGQQGYYALFVDGSMDTGMSRPTATFKNPCLAGSERFEVDSVECWRVERPEADEDGNPTSSVLDRYKADKVLLQLAGKMDGASDGYRHRHKNLAPEDDF